ncbi:putative secreted protein (Por secretion system target) [Winogradskyella wandonensis]|uniref:Putative secreted protein (Por secretion system target) n=1 Tax=Winogradskyella wandonensis TaxID=1442586 RepID=A0A4R1KWV8_9FLAO|nr:zinc-dependent metalloprotease family protein [Winogradskyella wandonensis]TCK69140.1 putative secreted protein (Por secretion system target) [Winogradskyella wandonensis]
MKKIYLFLLILPFFAFSQKKSFWTKTSASKIQQSQLLERGSTPTKFDVYNLNFEGIKNELGNAVSRSSSLESNTYIKFPNAEGKLERYQIYNASIMEPEFAAKHPEIQSYVGINIDNPGVTMRFSTTIFGFHAAIYTIGKTYYIDPYTEDLNAYILYAKENLYSDIDRIGCQLTDEMALESPYTPDTNRVSGQRNANDGLLRTFRLSLSSTQEYSNFHINAAGQQTASDLVKRQTVLAAMNVTMTRVNGLFERDLSLTMELVEIIDPPFSNTSTISLVEPDGFTDNDPGALLSENQSITDTRIGTANYDVGHVFTTGGGGVAILGGICFSNAKARAVTGLPSPVGDPYDVDFVAHEMGHHFGANHTFNGSQGNCSGTNRNASTSVEPGSGTTIMAYAGICGGDNIQNNSDDHFNAISIDEIYARITSSPTCSVNTSNGNTAPTVNAGQDYTIPFGTAFTLSGTASDPDGGAVLSYNWEQVNPGTVAGQPSSTDTDGPMFRSRPSLPTGERTFPQLSDILADNLTPQWEVIPSVARTMDFALTVRDNQSPNGGQTNRDDMTVTVANTGPFAVTAPNTTNESFPSGSSTTITWDVAGTTANGINTNNVNILFSTDGGLTFSTILASNTPNDGSETITFPSVQEPYCRIKIEPVDNIYFAISKSFSVGATVTVTETCNTYTTGPISTPIPDNDGTNNGVVFVPITVTETTPVTDLKVSANVSHTAIGDLLLQLQPAGDGFANIWFNNCGVNEDMNVTLQDGAGPIVCGSPTVGTFSPDSPLSAFYDGSDRSGVWNLVFVDLAPVDTGIVNEWSVELCTTTTNITLDTDNFELNDFTLFPNPNSGDFTLQFNSNSGKDINVDVYDISGKLVYKNSYNATSRFDKQINLNNVSTGIYIMKVNDGDKSVTRKLIIE